MKWIEEIRDIVGPQAIAADPGQLATYETDAFTLVRGRPDAVVFPGSTGQAAAVVRATARHGVPIVPRGAGTSLAGGTVAVDGGLCICLSRMRRIIDVDIRNRFAHVEAGVVNLALTQHVRAAGFHYAPDPSSQSVCTIGGNVATNSGGPHTLKLGVTAQHVLGVVAVMADGDVRQFGGPYEDAPGGDLVGLIVGSEGTLCLITEAFVRLTRLPQEIRTMLAVFDTIPQTTHTISSIVAKGIVPAALEMMDGPTIAAVEEWLHLGLPRDAGAVLIIEIDGLAAGLDRQIERVSEVCRACGCREMRVAADERQRNELWAARKKSFGALGRFGLSLCTQDGVVPPSRTPEIMDFIGEVAARYNVKIACVIHAGDGNIHPILLYDERDPAQVRAVVAAGYDILERCIALGGTITGEHGVGIEKINHLRMMFDETSLDAQQRVRDVFDPGRRLNPAKIFATGGACIELLRPPRGIPA
jgi:glycolate oxidase